MPKDQLRAIEEEFLKEFDIIEDKIVAPKVLEFLKKHIEAAYAQGEEDMKRRAIEIVDYAIDQAETVAILYGGTVANNIHQNIIKPLTALAALPVQSKE